MLNTEIESGFRFANGELERRIELLEEKLAKKESAEKALQDSEKRYRRLFESARDGILILDANSGRIVDVNPFLMELLGYSYDSLHGKQLWEIGCFKDIAASKNAFKALQENEYIRYKHLPLQSKRGHVVEVEFISNTYLVDGVEVIQCNIRDISARTGIERALKESEKKTRAILDNIGIGVALIGPEMEVLELNRRMREWFPLVDIEGRPACYHAICDSLHDKICDDCPVQKTFRDGAVHEAAMQTPLAGTMRDYRIVSSPIFDSSGEVAAVIAMVDDVTERLSLEFQLLQAQKMEAVGRLAGGVAHDFNNVLTVIQGYAELALFKLDALDPLRENIREILKAANRSAELTRQLLAFSRKQTIAPKVIDLNETVEPMLNMLRRMIGEDVELAWLPESHLWKVKMDPAQIDQILANLCVNARDAIADVGKITIKTGMATFDEIRLHGNAGFAPGDFVVLTVGDDGCGMDSETIEKLFEPFFTTKAVGRGTGLGLSTVYGIVRQNEGFVKVRSEPGKGSIFKIYLPRHRGEAVDPRKKASAPGIPKGCGETVLIVEDDVKVLKLTRTMIERLGYAALTASTVDEAMRLAEEHSSEIDLLVTDIVMPEMNGRDLAERLLRIKPNLKTLFMSGYTSDVITRRGVLEEGVCFIQKPFQTKDLAEKMREALDRE